MSVEKRGQASFRLEILANFIWESENGPRSERENMPVPFSPPHNLPSNPLGTPTEINDETGDSKTSKGVQCTEVPDADEACVNRALQIGQKTGNWEPWNNCNTLANSILSKCSKCKQKAAQSDPTMPPPEIL